MGQCPQAFDQFTNLHPNALIFYAAICIKTQKIWRLSLIALTAALQSNFQEYPREARTKDGKPHDGQPKEYGISFHA
jgi:hypothetical protein